jgi:methionine synthase I (cobalamin-dependent)
VDLGAQLVGGCCGIRPEHIRALRERLPSRVP